MMEDSYGDGWNGNVFRVLDGGGQQVVSDITLDEGKEAGPTPFEIGVSGDYHVTIANPSNDQNAGFPGEITWKIYFLEPLVAGSLFLTIEPEPEPEGEPEPEPEGEP